MFIQLQQHSSRNVTRRPTKRKTSKRTKCTRSYTYMYVSRYPAALLLPWIARLKTDKNAAEKLLYHRVGGGYQRGRGWREKWWKQKQPEKRRDQIERRGTHGKERGSTRFQWKRGGRDKEFFPSYLFFFVRFLLRSSGSGFFRVFFMPSDWWKGWRYAYVWGGGLDQWVRLYHSGGSTYICIYFILVRFFMGVLDRQVRQGRDRASLFGIKSFRTRREKKWKSMGIGVREKIRGI